MIWFTADVLSAPSFLETPGLPGTLRKNSRIGLSFEGSLESGGAGLDLGRGYISAWMGMVLRKSGL